MEEKELSETEKKIYLILSLIFEKIMDAEPSYELGFYQWTRMRPEILQMIGLDDELWTKLSDYGDQNESLQERLITLREKYENYSRDLVLNKLSSILSEI